MSNVEEVTIKYLRGVFKHVFPANKTIAFTANQARIQTLQKLLRHTARYVFTRHL